MCFSLKRVIFSGPRKTQHLLLARRSQLHPRACHTRVPHGAHGRTQLPVDGGQRHQRGGGTGALLLRWTQSSAGSLGLEHPRILFLCVTDPTTGALLEPRRYLMAHRGAEENDDDYSRHLTLFGLLSLRLRVATLAPVIR